MKTYAYGFPRLGRERQFKRLIEGYWSKKVNKETLFRGLGVLDEERRTAYRAAVDLHAVGEMTHYDQMLDTALMLGLYPGGNNLDRYFDLARGAKALEMTKWFNTNYHYLVPEIPWKGDAGKIFTAAWNKPLDAWSKHRDGVPFLIGPYTFLRLSKGYPASAFGDLLKALIPAYVGFLTALTSAGVSSVHLDEPALAGDVPEDHRGLLPAVYGPLGKAASILLMTAYDRVEFLPELLKLPVAGIGLDFVHGPGQLEELRRIGFPQDKILIAGVVDGRNIWKTDIAAGATTIHELGKLGAKDLWLSNAAPLFHLPVHIAGEDSLPPGLRERIAFADERLAELKILKAVCEKSHPGEPLAWNTYAHSTGDWHNEAVRERLARLSRTETDRALPYDERAKLQHGRLGLPRFPTTTIGSFPQTEDVRKARADAKAGRMTAQAYEAFVREHIAEVVKVQEDLGLDVLVHGEFERSDMVEYFAERLAGVAITRNGWIISYGTRAYRPAIIYGDVSRPEPMTVKEITYAQSLTKKPMKGMLTGPITILAWSFCRNDQPEADTARQLALAIRDEVHDLEKAGIGVIQIDEPAFRERAPLKRAGWGSYFSWAAEAFRLCSRARPETQIHTHMCYSEFNEIISHIAAMDADVITIEASRSRGEVIEAFERERYLAEIGPGVYDIHSPAVPTVEQIIGILERAARVIPTERLWVNPDCGLKTRDWPEVREALANMVAAARRLREKQ